MIGRAILNCAGLLVLSGCASYEPTSAPVPAPVPDAEVTSVGSYAATINPYVDPALQETVFDADFHEAGLLALQVVAKNTSERPALVRRTDMVLTLPDGQRISPLSAHSAAVRVGEEGSVLGMTLAFGIIGGLAASSAEDTARSARIADYESKQFKDVTLGPQESAHGFVFFAPPSGTGSFNEAKLDIRFVDVDTAMSKVVSVPMKGLAFAGAASGESVPAHQIRRTSVACDASEDRTKPWIGNWNAKIEDAILRLSIAEDTVRGELKIAGKTYAIRGSVDNRGFVNAATLGTYNYDVADVEGLFPVVHIVTRGSSVPVPFFRRVSGRPIRLCT